MHHLPARVATDSVGSEEFAAETASVEPLAHRPAGRSPQDLLARLDVSDHDRVEMGFGSNLSVRLPYLDRWEGPICEHAGSCGEPVHCLGAAQALRDSDKVDGVTSVGLVAGPASPSLMATVVGVDRDRCVSVIVICDRAVPATSPCRVCSGFTDLIEQVSEVSSSEYVVDPPARPTGHVDMAPSVNASVISLRVSTVWTTAPLRCSLHNARPRTSWPIQSRSRSESANSSAATPTWSAG